MRRSDISTNSILPFKQHFDLPHRRKKSLIKIPCKRGKRVSEPIKAKLVERHFISIMKTRKCNKIVQCLAKINCF